MLCREAGEHALCVQTPLSLSRQHGNHGGFYHSIDVFFPEGYVRALDKTQRPGGKRPFSLSFSPWIFEREDCAEMAKPLEASSLSAAAITLAPPPSPTHGGLQVRGKAGRHTGRKGDPLRVCGIDGGLVGSESLCLYPQ